MHAFHFNSSNHKKEEETAIKTESTKLQILFVPFSARREKSMA